MDTTKTITHVSLCAGYGGIDLGLKRAIPNLRTVAFSEIESFACSNLVSKMEKGFLDIAPIWTDVKTFPFSAFLDRVDILSGGYPCQPFSAHGKRLGKDDPRHLWPWISDGIVSMRPRLVFFENVEGHITLGLREVISDLESRGYKAAWGVFSASEVGSSHQRKRVFILAHLSGEGLERNLTGLLVSQGRQNQVRSTSCSSRSTGVWPSRQNEPQYGWEPPRVVGKQKKTQPSLVRNIDGNPDRLGNAELYQSCDNRADELRLLGNGVVPATAELAFRTLLEELKQSHERQNKTQKV